MTSKPMTVAIQMLCRKVKTKELRVADDDHFAHQNADGIGSCHER